MSKAIMRISESLRCSEEDARKFCNEVQKAIGKSPPSYKVIADCIGSKEPNDFNVESVAKALLESGWDSSKKNKKSSKKAGKRSKTGSTVRNFRFWDLPDSSSRASTSGREQGVESRSVFDKERFPLHKMKKCPHGVPTTRLCAICDPEKFKEMTGID